MNDRLFAELLAYFNYSWAGYRKVRKGVKKRIARHMRQLDCRDMACYIQKLKKDPALRRTCENLLAVPISRFFRDKKCWAVLQENILPGFVNKKKVTIWSAGCAGGEEVYTIKIIWEILQQQYPGFPALQIVATDINPDNLERGRSGIYRPSSLKEVDPGIRDRFFFKEPGKKLLAVRSDLKNGIVWGQHDLLSDRPPLPECDILFLRNNILTYCLDESKHAGFLNAVSALLTPGILVIGSKESLPEGVTGLVCEKLPYMFIMKKT